MGGSKTTQTTNVPPPTPAELQKQQIDLQLAQAQLKAIQQQETLQAQIQPLLLQEAGLIPTYGPAADPARLAAIDQEIAALRQGSGAQGISLNLGGLRPEFLPVNQQRIDALTAERGRLASGGAITGYTKSPKRIAQENAAQAQQDRHNALQTQLLEAEVARIQQGTRATPEQKALIAQSTDAAIAAGESDISRFQKELTNVLTREFSQAAGLRPTDTPIQDRGARIAEEGTRQQGQLMRNLRGAQAEAELNFPLAASQVQSAATGQQQELLLRTQAFQDSLRQQNFQNRFQASGFQGGLGIAGAAANNRFTAFDKGSTVTQKTSGNFLTDVLVPVAGVAGAAFTGGASLAAAAGLKGAQRYMSYAR